jgi:abortive infection bacteriophage resistance protein
MLTDNKEDHEFKKGSTFENAFQMYCFDRELKQLISGDIEKIEVSFRAKLTYVLSHKYNAFWYTYEGLFKNKGIHLKSLETTYKMVSDSTEDFAIKYRKKYVNTYQPSWMALEIVTFTHLSVVYENLKDTAAKSKIAEHYGVPYQLLENWLKILTYTRNICAHHSRFWNRNLSLPIKKATKELPFDWIEQIDIPRNKSYIYLSAIKYLLDRVNPNNTFTERITNLFQKYNNIDIHKGMSFPEDWKEQPLWKSSLKEIPQTS